MKTFFFTFIAICTVITMNSCSDLGDTTPPVINLIAPTEGAVLGIGSDILFSMELSDNEMLDSYKVDIHSNFDGHDHSRAEEGTTPYTFRQTWSVAGQRTAEIRHHEIVIAVDATPGEYHMVVYCTDASGNESHAARNIVLSHEADYEDPLEHGEHDPS